MATVARRGFPLQRVPVKLGQDGRVASVGDELAAVQEGGVGVPPVVRPPDAAQKVLRDCDRLRTIDPCTERGARLSVHQWVQ